MHFNRSCDDFTPVSRSQTPYLQHQPPGTLAERGIVFGASYESTAVVPEGSEPPCVANPVTDYVPNARPGSRAPHVWLRRGNERLSTLDLFGNGFILLAAEEGDEWCHAAKSVADDLHMPLRACTIGTNKASDLTDLRGAWARLYGVGRKGAVLVRPDGYVAWRSQDGDAAADAVLTSALAAILGRV